MPAATGGDPVYEDVTAYTAARREQTGPPPGFRMYGETFTCHRILDVAVLLDYGTDIDANVEVVVAQLRALRGLLDEDSLGRFEKLYADRKRPVDTSMIARSLELVFAGYTGRPTQESSSSHPAPRKRGKNSRGGSSSPAPALRSA